MNIVFRVCVNNITIITFSKERKAPWLHSSLVFRYTVNYFNIKRFCVITTQTNYTLENNVLMVHSVLRYRANIAFINK